MAKRDREYPVRCEHCKHREEDHVFGVYVDAEPCAWPGCDCDSWSEEVIYPAEEGVVDA